LRLARVEGVVAGAGRAEGLVLVPVALPPGVDVAGGVASHRKSGIRGAGRAGRSYGVRRGPVRDRRVKRPETTSAPPRPRQGTREERARDRSAALLLLAHRVEVDLAGGVEVEEALRERLAGLGDRGDEGVLHRPGAEAVGVARGRLAEEGDVVVERGVLDVAVGVVEVAADGAADLAFELGPHRGADGVRRR